MKQSATTPLLATVLLCGSLAACADDAAVSTGRALFEQNCQRCHGAIPGFKTRADELAGFLRAGTVRPHHFTLSDAELEQLAAYIASLQEH